MPSIGTPYTVAINFVLLPVEVESSGMQRRVVTLRLTDVSEVHTASIIWAIWRFLLEHLVQ
jgi:hypothetical protein